ncbi:MULTISPECIES: CDP-diacylglycerol--serine O-phosphatidyltransferase [Marinomonas]|uniref:CDP-diacylglycerol--serine O-phosphatidyltransferase n=1 Tax=Marinomonas arctica TaxID=383750 RepID=A0A7H1J9B8_9GAMM|nr:MULTISPECIES: CDP-diacylglycerol--serine O-phosphatidyltransferase [Marinomonas]MCS7487361.1 CDP-diacylglycerol--serine O-phosphatidyltransferase [Marinomonas sp. BSi20414]QNT07084.1 CDP-diacylglycerol--serine O-phosphatidyltransferase [Marinomonas arctica]GGN34959.1 phosphatidylserine synthase [Marinomonas arctica]
MSIDDIKKSPVDEIEDIDVGDEKKQPHKGVYLLPNLFTTAALFSGFYSIIAAMNGNYSHAAVAIFISMIFDGLDGRVARLTHTQSAFGAEYDSLADMVSFGIAPALIVFTWSLAPLGKIGWIAAFIYAVGAALRLARFNTMIGVEEKRYFTGLPSPAAAAIVAGVIWAANDNGISGESMATLMALLVPITGLLMVSNVKYRSFKDLDLKGRVPFVVLLIAVLILVFVALQPAFVLMSVFCLYGLWGPLAIVFKRLR